MAVTPVTRKGPARKAGPFTSGPPSVRGSRRSGRLRWVLALLLMVSAGQAQERTLPLRGDRFEVDIYGSIYVLDTESSMLRVFDARGELLREVGGQGWSNEQFDQPHGVWARNGLNIFVADYGNHRIQRYDRTISYVATLSTREAGDPAIRFGYPTDVSVSRQGDLFLCDGENVRVLKVNQLDEVDDRSFGGPGAGRGTLSAPAMIEVGPGDYVYVLDEDRVVVFDTFGNYIREVGSELVGKPRALFADERCILVLDRSGVLRFDESGRLTGRGSLKDMPAFGRELRDIGLYAGELYLLADDGLHVFPAAPYLDKETKSP